MSIERRNQTVRTSSLARAAVSPSALVLTGVGIAAGVAVGLPVLAAIGVGIACWAARVAVAAGLARRRLGRADQPEPIDAYAVPEPWRIFVQEALTAQVKYGQAVEHCPVGPLQDRLREISARVNDGVQECWIAAQLGSSISAVLAGQDPSSTRRQLREVQARRSSAEPGTPSRAALDASESALAGRLQASKRLEGLLQTTSDRLGLLAARLDEAVADALELSMTVGDPSGAQPIAGSVESVVGEMESLRLAMQEASGTSATGGPTKT